jgi:hypothetical protein
VHFPNSPIEELGRVDVGWWNGFRERFKHVLTTKRGEKFEHFRADWSQEPYIAQMYNVIYDNMVEAGVAIKLDSPVIMDSLGNIVQEDDPNRLGLACDIQVIHPEMILFADETGCNTSQKKRMDTLEDGNFWWNAELLQRQSLPLLISTSLFLDLQLHPRILYFAS